MRSKSNVGPFGATLGLLLIVSWSIASAQQVKTRNDSAGSSPRDLTLSRTDGLISMRAAGVDLRQVLDALSKASGVPIVLIDRPGTRDLVTISFTDRTSQEAIREVMTNQAAGSVISSATSRDRIPTAVYVVTAREMSHIRTATQMMLQRIDAGETPPPRELTDWLREVATIGFSVDAPGTSMLIVPSLRLIDQKYIAYEELVVSLFADPSVSTPLRSAMLELLARHWDRPVSRESVLGVFVRSLDDPVLQGQVALALAQRGEVVGPQVLSRYSLAPPAARFYYAQALAIGHSTQAIEALREDAQPTRDWALRDAAICSLIALDAGSRRTAGIADDAIHAAKESASPDRTADDIYREALAMHVVMAVARATPRGINDKMLPIALDASLTVNVRIAALEALTSTVSAMTRNDIESLVSRLPSLEEQVRTSATLSGVSQTRMTTRLRALRDRIDLKGGN